MVDKATSVFDEEGVSKGDHVIHWQRIFSEIFLLFNSVWDAEWKTEFVVWIQTGSPSEVNAFSELRVNDFQSWWTDKFLFIFQNKHDSTLWALFTSLEQRLNSISLGSDKISPLFQYLIWSEIALNLFNRVITFFT